MRRGDLVEGREYARTRRSWLPAERVRLVAIDGEAEVERFVGYSGRTVKVKRRGIVVEFLDGNSAGDRMVLDNARTIVGEWSSVDRDQRRAAAREAAAARIRGIVSRADDAIEAAAEEAKIGRPSSVESAVNLIAHVLDAGHERRGELRALVTATKAIAATAADAIREVEERRDADLAEIEAEAES